MAGATQHRSRGSLIKTPPASSDEGTLADAPLTDTPLSGETLRQHGQASQSDPEQAGAAHDEVAPLGANVIEALKIVSKLEKLELDKQEISMPKCIVLGQQSTGKSSVIEAISGIKTPRDTGTCTRCPLFIELQPAADANSSWRAEIQLLRLYDLLTDPRHRGMDTEFPGWIPAAVPGKTAFAQVNNPDDLESYIRCAQRATLSPLEDPQAFLDPSFDDRDIHRTLFSPNIVCITVSKSGLPPLSFFDLPGMIGQAETEEEEYTVPLIKALVTKYILDEEALVLVTCALENDVHNSIAAGLARELRVTPRCLGVLTKPDRLPQGSSAQDLAHILDGRRFTMGHGYFVVKNLNSNEIRQGLTHNDARRLEQEFFATVSPWAVDLQAYQPRFGTVNMQHHLASELGNRVMRKLPVIHRQIEARLEAVEAELSRIPDTPLHTAVRTVADVIQGFCTEVRSEVAGEYGHVTWYNTWKGCQKALWEALLKLKPTMPTTGDLDKSLFTSMLPGQTADEAMVIDSDDDPEPETPSKKRKYDTPPKRESRTPAPSASPFRTPNKPAAKPSRVLLSTSTSLDHTSDIAKLRRPCKLDDVTKRLSLASRGRVPGQIDPQVREEMMIAPLANWSVTAN
ncbi:hypothetical protein E8E12_007575 [Didymella heteroderae]|uniref:Dynamin-type G domain-containing protein n=1 Tax=Didymella heteroderae TaxID=1769908 RepID=A0A9P4WNJ0_9PLEO|nr:hypothetical protein E8E12_007575 [Didymella heteroderae]